MAVLSVIIPVYNEQATITEIIKKVLAVTLDPSLAIEIVVVNDGSFDNTVYAVNDFCHQNKHLPITFVQHTTNKGKGAAIRTGIKVAKGNYIIIQDGDLEYSPGEYPLLLQPLLTGHADVVYGSRFVGSKPHRVLFFWHALGNRVITFFSNIFCNLNLTDVECGYKLFKAEILKSVSLKESRFGFEVEVTMKIARLKNIRIYEVGISYHGRTYSEGKKVGIKDGWKALWCVFKYGIKF